MKTKSRTPRETVEDLRTLLRGGDESVRPMLADALDDMSLHDEAEEVRWDPVGTGERLGRNLATNALSGDFSDLDRRWHGLVRIQDDPGLLRFYGGPTAYGPGTRLWGLMEGAAREAFELAIEEGWQGWFNDLQGDLVRNQTRDDQAEDILGTIDEEELHRMYLAGSASEDVAEHLIDMQQDVDQEYDEDALGDAYNEGARAHSENASYDTNPYPDGDLADQWSEGWDDYEPDYEEEELGEQVTKAYVNPRIGDGVYGRLGLNEYRDARVVALRPDGGVVIEGDDGSGRRNRVEVPFGQMGSLSRDDESEEPELAEPELRVPATLIEASRARVEIPEDDPAVVRTLARELLGSDDDVTLATMTGAPDDAVVQVVATRSRDGRVNLFAKAQSEAVKLMRGVSTDTDGFVYMTNHWIKIVPELRGSGLGLRTFCRQVDFVQPRGVAYIECHAARQGLDTNEYNGYYTWPRFGYDAELDDDVLREFTPQQRRELRAYFPGVDTVQDIMATERGRAWWKLNGVDLVHARFDLNQGSRSMQVLRAYREERAKLQQKSVRKSRSPEQTVRDFEAMLAAGDESVRPYLADALDDVGRADEAMRMREVRPRLYDLRHNDPEINNYENGQDAFFDGEPYSNSPGGEWRDGWLDAWRMRVEEGLEARADGEPAEANPYGTEEPNESSAWLQGWRGVNTDVVERVTRHQVRKSLSSQDLGVEEPDPTELDEIALDRAWARLDGVRIKAIVSKSRSPDQTVRDLEAMLAAGDESVRLYLADALDDVGRADEAMRMREHRPRLLDISGRVQDDAYTQGDEAFSRGELLTSNPHLNPSVLRSAWAAGWLQAEVEYDLAADHINEDDADWLREQVGEGRMAFADGQPRDSNPHHVDSEEHQLWDAGYDLAADYGMPPGDVGTRDYERLEVEGRRAFLTGEPRASNPYQEGIHHELWDDGWNEACRRQRRRSLGGHVSKAPKHLGLNKVRNLVRSLESMSEVLGVGPPAELIQEMQRDCRTEPYDSMDTRIGRSFANTATRVQQAVRGKDKEAFVDELNKVQDYLTHFVPAKSGIGDWLFGMREAFDRRGSNSLSFEQWYNVVRGRFKTRDAFLSREDLRREYEAGKTPEEVVEEYTVDVRTPPRIDEAGRRIRELRAGSGVSMAEVARRIGTSPAHLSQVENGRVRATEDMVQRITEALGVEESQVRPKQFYHCVSKSTGAVFGRIGTKAEAQRAAGEERLGISDWQVKSRSPDQTIRDLEVLLAAGDESVRPYLADALDDVGRADEAQRMREQRPRLENRFVRVEVDVTFDEDDQLDGFLQDARNLGLQAIVVDPAGPGGGAAVVQISGNRHDVERLMANVQYGFVEWGEELDLGPYEVRSMKQKSQGTNRVRRILVALHTLSDEMGVPAPSALTADLEADAEDPVWSHLKPQRVVAIEAASQGCVDAYKRGDRTAFLDSLRGLERELGELPAGAGVGRWPRDLEAAW